MDTTENIKTDDILVCIDGSYFIYYVIFGAVKEYISKNSEEASILIKDPEEVDQSNFPDILVSDSFKRELKKNLIKRFETVDWLLKQNFQDQIDLANDIHYLFAMDDFVSRSFRRNIYPEYKAQRSQVKKAYDVYKIKDYIMDVLIPELDIAKKFNYNFLKANGAEGDDLIAWIMMSHDGKSETDKYFLKILIASDKDFLQIPGIHQYDLSGREMKPNVKVKGETIDLNPGMFLLQKIIMGDSADNIPAIGEKIGPVKAYKLASDHEKLKSFLLENQDAAKQFKLNRELIDFKKIPDELQEKLKSTVDPVVYRLFESKRRVSDSIMDDLLKL